VDDDPQVLKLLRLNFELEGYDVASATDGAGALEAIERDLPDAVVCDVMMPGIDGLEVVKRLRSAASTASLPVVLLSAKALRGDAEAGIDAGADEYVTKPFDPAELVGIVAGLITKPKSSRR
jgi:DNA-binding response OmpR family regulator